MAIPTNRSEFSAYCLRRLGSPVIQVNVSTDQIDDRIDEALYKYYQRNFNAVEEVYIIHDVTTPEKITDSNGDDVLDSNGDPTYTTNTDTEKGYIQLPNTIVGVSNVFKPKLSGGVSIAEFNFYMNDLYSAVHPNSYNIGSGVSYYYLYQSHLTLLNNFFDPEQSFDYNPTSNRLKISGGLKNVDRQYGGIIVRAFAKLKGHGELDSNDPVIDTHNIWKDNWLQKYATALIKQQWAQNLSKYQSVQLLGGVQMNGEALWLQAQEEINKLEEQLQNEYELPVDFFMA